MGGSNADFVVSGETVAIRGKCPGHPRHGDFCRSGRSPRGGGHFLESPTALDRTPFAASHE